MSGIDKQTENAHHLRSVLFCENQQCPLFGHVKIIYNKDGSCTTCQQMLRVICRNCSIISTQKVHRGRRNAMTIVPHRLEDSTATSHSAAQSSLLENGPNWNLENTTKYTVKHFENCNCKKSETHQIDVLVEGYELLEKELSKSENDADLKNDPIQEPILHYKLSIVRARLAELREWRKTM